MEKQRIQTHFMRTASDYFDVGTECLPAACRSSGARACARGGWETRGIRVGLIRVYLKTNPSSADAHFLLGYVLFREQKAKESLAEFTAGAKFRRPHPDELKVVASDYVILGDFGDADKWFSEVVAEDPNDADANYLLGRTKFNENDFPAAISSFRAR